MYTYMQPTRACPHRNEQKHNIYRLFSFASGKWSTISWPPWSTTRFSLQISMAACTGSQRAMARSSGAIPHRSTPPWGLEVANMGVLRGFQLGFHGNWSLFFIQMQILKCPNVTAFLRKASNQFWWNGMSGRPILFMARL